MEFYNDKGQLIDSDTIEKPEQDLAQMFIQPEDCVLELSARFGTVSCTINRQLKIKTNQVVVEPDERVWNALEENKKRNGCEFHIIKGFVSRQKLGLTNLDTHFGGYGARAIPDASTNISSYKLEDITTKYGLIFNVLVADCEGFFETFIQENPSILSTLRLIVFEADYPEHCNYDNVHRILLIHQFYPVVRGHQNVYLRSDLPAQWSEVCKLPGIVLGLQRYAFRREFTAARLAQLGFTSLQFVDGVDGFHEDTQQELRRLGYTMDASLGKGQQACCISYLREWTKFVESGENYRFYFEDDAMGHLDLPHGLGQAFWDETPRDFDILYLGNMMGTQDAQLKNPTMKVVRLPTYTTHAFMLSRKGAIKLLELAKATNAQGLPIQTIDIQLYLWQIQGHLKWYCWNGTWVQKSYPTFDEGLPWQMFNEVILPQKDTGLFYQNMRLGSTLSHPTLQLSIPQYSL